MFSVRAGKEEIQFLRKNHLIGTTAKHSRWKLSIIGSFLAWYDNPILEKMRIPWPQESRINVDWLTPEEAALMRRAAQGIEKLIIHLELDLGMRRIDMYRLKMSDIHDCYFNVLGKGRGGGKLRTVSWRPNTEAILKEYYIFRQEKIDYARKYKQRAEEPDGLLIYQKGGSLGQYQMTAIDEIVSRVAIRAGIRRKITNHTLRRTCGRLLHLSGVKIETIADILGHSDIRTTLRYLGLRLDDQRDALEKGEAFMKKIEAGMIANVAKEKEN